MGGMVSGSAEGIASILSHDIMSDGMTVWVHDEHGACIGRFSRFGVDVHQDFEGQLAGGPQCLDCCHDLPPKESWERFVVSMRNHHGVSVCGQHIPAFVRSAMDADAWADQHPLSTPIGSMR